MGYLGGILFDERESLGLVIHDILILVRYDLVLFLLFVADLFFPLLFGCCFLVGLVGLAIRVGY